MGAGRQAALSYGVRMRTLARALRSLKACDAPPSDNGCRAAKARHVGVCRWGGFAVRARRNIVVTRLMHETAAKPRLGRCILGGLALPALAGCTSVSPMRVTSDRLDYGQVVAESWKRQTLMNVVRLRYADAPMFLDVASIINSYTVRGKCDRARHAAEPYRSECAGARRFRQWVQYADRHVSALAGRPLHEVPAAADSAGGRLPVAARRLAREPRIPDRRRLRQRTAKRVGRGGIGPRFRRAERSPVPRSAGRQYRHQGAVPYKGHWYWIDDNDVASKRTFTFLMILFSLAETGQSSAAPVVTVPTR